LNAAARVIATEGRDVSMATIASAAGVARATLYRYFPTRDALFEELNAATIADASRRLTAAELAGTDPKTAIERAVRALFEIGDPFAFVVRDARRSEAFQGGVSEPLRNLLQRGQKHGEISSEYSARFLAEVLVGIVQAAVSHTASLRNDEVVALTTALFLHGVTGRPRAVPARD
jgi:TetR/AcrR family transcriptional regulator, mexCD-oprJ operon repressor